MNKKKITLYIIGVILSIFIIGVIIGHNQQKIISHDFTAKIILQQIRFIIIHNKLKNINIKELYPDYLQYIYVSGKQYKFNLQIKDKNDHYIDFVLKGNKKLRIRQSLTNNIIEVIYHQEKWKLDKDYKIYFVEKE